MYASTSSVYGRYASGDEGLPTRPISPYGMTKLAAEHLCRAYAEERGLSLVVLRYFSVYGPRQRPDMGYRRFIAALLANSPVVVFGDGQQARGNTYIDDCVEATVVAMDALPMEIFNVGGGEVATVWEILHKLEALLGRKAIVQREPTRPGDRAPPVPIPASCTAIWAGTLKSRWRKDWPARSPGNRPREPCRQFSSGEKLKSGLTSFQDRLQ